MLTTERRTGTTSRTRRHLVVLVLAALAAVVVVGCGEQDADDQTGAAALILSDFDVTPQELELTAGADLTVINDGDAEHTVTATDGSFDVRLAGGQTASITVDEPGSYPFTCEFHPQMSGTVTVTG